MDKFGIFNLLSSFLDKNQHPENAVQPENPLHRTETSTPKPIPVIPLQSNMLNTMNSHDLFVKRVKEKNAINRKTDGGNKPSPV